MCALLLPTCSTWRTEAELGLYTVTRADGAPETVAPGNVCPSAAPAAANPGRSASKLVRVSAHHLGVYAFKDCRELAMVCLTSDVMATNTEAQLATSGAKGRCFATSLHLSQIVKSIVTRSHLKATIISSEIMQQHC